MEKFKIKVTERMLLTQIFEVEAESEEDAISLFCDELAGSIDPISEDIREWNDNDSVDVVIY